MPSRSRIPPEVLKAVDQLGPVFSSREVAEAVSRATGYPVTQSAVIRRRRQRKEALRAETRAAVLAVPIVRRPEPPPIRHIRDTDTAAGRDLNHCWVCGEPGTVPGGLSWGRCGLHNGGRSLSYLYWLAGCDVPGGWPGVPEGGLGPDVAA